MIPATEALERLREGNRRFVADERRSETIENRAHRRDLANGQAPFAVILGCSDSRVPVEIVFDQGLGDLFVIRVAGNIVAPSQIGSVEFAAEQFGTRLVVVLGHTRCGAIEATLDALRQPGTTRSRNLQSIVGRIGPAIESLLEAGPHDPETLAREAMHANIRASVDHLRHGSPMIEDLVRSGGLLVVGAAYSLETGQVDFPDAENAAWTGGRA